MLTEDAIHGRVCITKSGDICRFDTNESATAPFGFRYGQRVCTPLGPATVIGVREDQLWFQIDGCPGLSYWGSCRNELDFSAKGVLKALPQSSKARVSQNSEFSYCIVRLSFIADVSTVCQDIINPLNATLPVPNILEPNTQVVLVALVNTIILQGRMKIHEITSSQSFVDGFALERFFIYYLRNRLIVIVERYQGFSSLDGCSLYKRLQEYHRNAKKGLCAISPFLGAVLQNEQLFTFECDKLLGDLHGSINRLSRFFPNTFDEVSESCNTELLLFAILEIPLVSASCLDVVTNVSQYSNSRSASYVIDYITGIKPEFGRNLRDQMQQANCVLLHLSSRYYTVLKKDEKLYTLAPHSHQEYILYEIPQHPSDRVTQ